MVQEPKWSLIEILILLICVLMVLTVLSILVIGYEIPVFFDYWSLIPLILILISIIFKNKKIGKWLNKKINFHDNFFS